LRSKQGARLPVLADEENLGHKRIIRGFRIQEGQDSGFRMGAQTRVPALL
jgi:hypothetical protein